jgi:hypothetical protein
VAVSKAIRGQRRRQVGLFEILLSIGTVHAGPEIFRA